MSKIATRESYEKTLVKENKSIIILDADLSKSAKTYDVKNSSPESSYNMGIAEANMVGIAEWLATVFASSFAIFLASRAFEQIRSSIAYIKSNVKLCGTHSGISFG